ncbi:AMP-binding protein [Jongsikchunia kroppenstedtii]|uniref:AMP-binding protein n=1 Tax=Jongsikchunia kroppenstedtii TaxID=1121721 RepID=UPI00037A74F3|nr:AMP-binding protein [Jongsikchunia kroppenstedtii]
MSFETLLTPERIARETDAGHWRGKVITDFLDEYAAATPDKVAFIDSRRQVTFAELKSEVDAFARGLYVKGIRSGDVVSFQIPNWIEWIVVHYAATQIGAISNPLIPIYREREVGFMVGLAAPKLIVVPREFRGFEYPPMLDGLAPDWDVAPEVVVVGERSWDDLLTAGEAVDPAVLPSLRPEPNDVTLLVFTSGTTGEPKGVLHTHNTMVAANDPLPERLGIGPGSVLHMASTLAHLTGFLYGARLGIQNGATCVLQDIWDASTFVELVERYGITYTSAATPFLHDLVAAPGLAEHDTTSLIRFCCMGAPIPRAMVREATEKLPRLVVVGGWGQTEEGLVTIGIPGDPEDKIVDTDGYPWPGMDIRVVDANGVEQSPGAEGALQVRGPFVFVGYAERLELARRQMVASDDDRGDWFDTGDLAFLDEEGYLRISGRTKDVIIRGGENIPVAYIENVLYEHRDIDAVAVVAVPDPRLQERACACVVLTAGSRLDLEQMQEFLSAKGVAKQYWPEKLVVFDSFPTTPSGKVQKFQLRQQVSL